MYDRCCARITRNSHTWRKKKEDRWLVDVHREHGTASLENGFLRRHFEAAHACHNNQIMNIYRGFSASYHDYLKEM